MALQPQADTTVPAGDSSRYSVLVADDEVSIRDLLKLVVTKRLQCCLLMAASGDEALEVAARERPDVLLTDMVMPGTHGLDLVREVKRVSPDTTIIAMTGHPGDFPYVEVVEAGAEDFVHKPFPPTEIEAKLVRVFRERDAQRAQRVAENKYRSLFEMSMDGMLIVARESYRVSDANHAFCELCGRTQDELAQLTLLDLFTPDARTRLEQWLTVCARSGKGTLADLTLQLPGGRAVHVDVSVTFIGANGEQMVFLAFKDVTDKVQVEQQLADAAQRDALTGLLNKRSFQNRLEVAVSRAREKGIPLALVFVDLDNFKQCNDTHGHQVGDQLLVSVSEAIQKSVRATADDGFRLGGDEFAVILKGADRETSVNVAERMQAEFAKNECYGTTMSIGIAQYTEELQPETLVLAADQALYKAKGTGKNRVHVA